MPPVPAFYAHPRSLDEMVSHSCARALDFFGIDTDSIQRWSGLKEALKENAP